MKNNLLKIGLFTLALCGIYACQTNMDRDCSLAGEWRFALDRNDVGETERWAERTFEERVNLPGSLQAQGKGDDVSVHTQWT